MGFPCLPPGNTQAPPSDCCYPLSPLTDIKLAPSSPSPITISTPFISLILSLSGKFINCGSDLKYFLKIY